MHVASFLKVGEGVKLIRNFDTKKKPSLLRHYLEGGGGRMGGGSSI